MANNTFPGHLAQESGFMLQRTQNHMMLEEVLPQGMLEGRPFVGLESSVSLAL